MTTQQEDPTQVQPSSLTNTVSKRLPLEGVAVVDATTDFAGQFCSRILSDAGAAVTRLAPEGFVSGGPWDDFLNLGKVRPPTVAGATSFRDLRQLVAGAHVLLYTRLEVDHPGLDLRSLAAQNSGLLVVCIPPFGSGPYEAFRSDDVVLSALCGLAHCTPGFPDRQEGEVQLPVQSLARLAEYGAGLITAIATMAALLQRLTTSTGPKVIEASQFEAIVSLMVSDWGLAAYMGQTPGRRRKGSMLEPNCYLPCKDGQLVIVATRDEHWEALVELLGSPPWARAERFATVAGRAEHWEDLHALLRDWASTQSGVDVMIRAQERGVPCTAVLELGDLLKSEQIRVLGSVEVIDGTTLPADPIVINGTRRQGRFGRQERVPSRAPFGDMPASADGPLTGVRVVDLSQLVAGPLTGQWLSALGAEVVIVESRRRPVSRMYGPFPAKPEYDAGPNFNHVNRGKRSLELDLKTAEGRRLLEELVRRSDVVLENFSKRAAQNLCLAYPELKAVRQDIIVASISAFGRSGPWGSYVSHHGGVTALSGLASVIRDHRGNPRLVGAIMPDVLTGTYMALAILEALITRAQTGIGGHVEVSMLDVMLNAMGGVVPAAARGEALGTHPARFFETSEAGKYLAVDGPGSQHALDQSISRLTRRDAMMALQSQGLCAGAVLDLLEVIDDPHLRARGFVQRVDHPVVGNRPVPAVPWTYDGRRPALGAAPVLGSDTEVIARDLLGLSTRQVARLRESGVLR